MKETLTQRLNALGVLVFDVELTLFPKNLHCLSQLFVVMEVLVIVFGSINAVHRTIVGLSKLLQPFLRVKIRNRLHYDSTI
jgi:hypothetical protein